MTTVLGIDPGSRVTGYGVLRIENARPRFLDCGCIRATEPEVHQRLGGIYESLRMLLDQHRPDVVAIESVFVHRNVQSALKLGQARGASLAAVAAAGCAFNEYSPAEIKQAVVGRGAADKRQVQYMVRRLLVLPGAPGADAADALAVALCHVFRMAGQRLGRVDRGQAGSGHRGAGPVSLDEPA